MKYASERSFNDRPIRERLPPAKFKVCGSVVFCFEEFSVILVVTLCLLPPAHGTCVEACAKLLQEIVRPDVRKRNLTLNLCSEQGLNVPNICSEHEDECSEHLQNSGDCEPGACDMFLSFPGLSAGLAPPHRELQHVHTPSQLQTLFGHRSCSCRRVASKNTYRLVLSVLRLLCGCLIRISLAASRARETATCLRDANTPAISFLTSSFSVVLSRVSRILSGFTFDIASLCANPSFCNWQPFG